MKKIISLVIPLLLLCSCNANKSQPVTHNYHETKESLIPWSDVFSQTEADYLVYFYSESCGHCNEIKQDVISFYLKELIDMYFVCTDIEANFGPTKDLIGVDNIESFYIFGTPFLTRIADYQVTEYYVGAKAIRNYINQFKY